MLGRHGPLSDHDFTLRMLLRRLLPILCLVIATGAQAQTFTNEFHRLRVLPASDKAVNDVAIADFNADGRLDFYHSGRLYRQAADGTFENVLDQAGIKLEGNAVRGGIFGDANQDGLLDLLIMDGLPGSRFYLNRSGEKFDLGNNATNIILQQPPVGAFWMDVNGDDFVDFVVGMSNGINPVFLGSANNKFTNVGPLMRAETPPATCGLAVGDFDRDQDPDIFVAKCGTRNSLLINNANSDRFSTNFRGAGVESSRVSQDGHWFDYNNDGWEDLLVVNGWREFNNGETHLYRNEQGQGFTDIAVEAGIAGLSFLGQGPAAIGDFDNDGWQDVYLPFNNHGQLYRNLGNGTFTEIFDQAIPLDSVSTAIATGDLNNDGWLDLVMPNQFGTALLMNDGGTNNWVTFTLRNPDRNRFGVGARIEVQTGNLKQVRVITAGTGAGSQGDGLRAHFGLGTATSIDQVQVEWPDGRVEIFQNVPINEHHTIVERVGFNNAPRSFALVSPLNAGFVDPASESIRFAWEEATDVDGVEYTLTITGLGLRLSYPGLTATELEVDASILPANQIYEWSVLATDGYSNRTSASQRSFSFGQPDVANQTLQSPVLYEFGLPRLSSGVTSFADIDLDGDLDLLVGGESNGAPVLRLYRADDATVVLDNNGGEYVFKSLNQAGIALEAVRNPEASWGDLNGDGFPDLLATGISLDTGEPLSTVYLNQVGQFIPTTLDALPNLWGGSATWADINGDGHDDIIVTGSSRTDRPYATESAVLLNDGNNGLIRVDAGMPAIMFGESAFADMDGDGDLDMALTGDLGGGRPHSGIYENTGVGAGGSFVLTSAPLPALMGGSVTWGDVDADGDPDLLISGGALDPHMLRGVTRVFVNDSGFFSVHPFPFDGVVTGRAIWGDYEGDGDQDVFVVGARSPLGETVGRLYRNVDGQFVAELDVKGFVNAAAAFGDYNADGDLDLIAFGIDATGTLSTTFYINQQIPEPVPVTR